VSEVVFADDLISIPQAARRVGLHADTLYRLCRMGQFPPAIRIGARWRVSVPRLERYLHADARRAFDPGSTADSKGSHQSVEGLSCG
jgi:excisionase family DNA binding protein